MTKKKSKPKGHFYCTICTKQVVISDPDDAEDFCIGDKLYCKKCSKEIITTVIKHLVKDTVIPKTYRKVFERYLEWETEK